MYSELSQVKPCRGSGHAVHLILTECYTSHLVVSRLMNLNPALDFGSHEIIKRSDVIADVEILLSQSRYQRG